MGWCCKNGWRFLSSFQIIFGGRGWILLQFCCLLLSYLRLVFVHIIFLSLDFSPKKIQPKIFKVLANIWLFMIGSPMKILGSKFGQPSLVIP